MGGRLARCSHPRTIGGRKAERNLAGRHGACRSSACAECALRTFECRHRREAAMHGTIQSLDRPASLGRSDRLPKEVSPLRLSPKLISEDLVLYISNTMDIRFTNL